MHLSSSHLSAEKLNDSLNVIRVCSSPSCEMLGQNLLIAEICRILGIELGESSSDGRFHLISMPCPGYCDKAPMFRVNDVSFEEQDIENIQKILNSYLLSVV